MSVIDTLVTNRSEADRRRVEQLTVLGWDNMSEEQRAEWLAGLKGAYNYTDLNRVTAALDYLAARLNESGYAVPGYQKHIVPHGWNTGKNLKNVVENGSFASNGAGWTLHSNYTTSFHDNGVSITVSANNTSTGTYPNTQMLPLIAGHKYFVAFDIKGATTNVSYPRVYLRYYLPDDETAYYINFASSTEYNTDDWTRYADVLTLDANRTWDRLAFGINRSNTGGDTMSLRSVMMVDLTEAFGAGMEPDVEWCQANIPYFEGTTSVGKEELDPYIWYERDIPSDSDLNAYLANVAAIRAALGTLPTTPEVPSDMDHLSIEEANAIEKILVDVDAQLRTMATTFIPAGVAISGGDNL